MRTQLPTGAEVYINAAQSQTLTHKPKQIEKITFFLFHDEFKYVLKSVIGWLGWLIRKLECVNDLNPI